MQSVANSDKYKNGGDEMGEDRKGKENKNDQNKLPQPKDVGTSNCC